MNCVVPTKHFNCACCKLFQWSSSLTSYIDLYFGANQHYSFNHWHLKWWAGSTILLIQSRTWFFSVDILRWWCWQRLRGFYVPYRTERMTTVGYHLCMEQYPHEYKQGNGRMNQCGLKLQILLNNLLIQSRLWFFSYDEVDNDFVGTSVLQHTRRIPSNKIMLRAKYLQYFPFWWVFYILQHSDKLEFKLNIIMKSS